MSFLSRPLSAPPPRNLCELFLRDVTSLLTTSHTVTDALLNVRTECGFPPDLGARLDAMIAASRAGEQHLHEPLRLAGVVLPPITDNEPGGLVTRLISRLPTDTLPEGLEAEIVGNMCLLAQHLELKARLAAEEALLIGHPSLARALLAWAAQWRTCTVNLQPGSTRDHKRTFVVDVAVMHEA